MSQSVNESRPFPPFGFAWFSIFTTKVTFFVHDLTLLLLVLLCFAAVTELKVAHNMPLPCGCGCYDGQTRSCHHKTRPAPLWWCCPVTGGGMFAAFQFCVPYLQAAAPPMRSPRTVVTPRGRIEVSARGSTTPRQNASQVVISPRTAIRVEETKSVLTSSTNRPSGGYGTSRSSSASRSGSAGVLQTSSPPNSARCVGTVGPALLGGGGGNVFGGGNIQHILNTPIIGRR